jgi:hypothetical protein
VQIYSLVHYSAVFFAKQKIKSTKKLQTIKIANIYSEVASDSQITARPGFK